MTHDEAERLLVAGAVLDDLSPDERAAYDRHRAGCTACLRLERELDGVLADLALIAPERPAPPGLLGGVLAAIGGATLPAPGLVPASGLAGGDGRIHTARLDAPRPSSAVAPVGRRTWAGSRLAAGALALAAVMAVVAVGLGVRGAGLERELGDAEARVAALTRDLAADDPVVRLAAAPDHVTVGLHPEPIAASATASVLYRPGTDDAYVVAIGLPPTEAGRVYQLWVADAKGVHGLATFTYDGDGPFVAPFGVDLAGSTAAMITLEPVGGAVAEPGPQVVFGEL